MRGAPALSIGFLTHAQKPPNVSGGGIANAIVGTFTMVGIAALISVPIGIGAGIFFSEWSNSKLSTISSFMNDVLTGFPSIVFRTVRFRYNCLILRNSFLLLQVVSP